MAVIANLVLNNGAATPVAKTFTPMDASSLAKWADQTVNSGLPAAANVVTMSHTDKGKIHTKVRIELPVMYAVTGATAEGFTPQPKVAYKLVANLDLVAEGVSSEANRADLLAFASNVLASAPVKDAFNKNIRTW